MSVCLAQKCLHDHSQLTWICPWSWRQELLPGVPAHLHVAGQLHQLLGVLLGAVPLGQLHSEELQSPLKVSQQQIILGSLETREQTPGKANFFTVIESQKQ